MLKICAIMRECMPFFKLLRNSSRSHQLYAFCLKVLVNRGLYPLLFQVRTHSKNTLGRVQQFSENTIMTIEKKTKKKYFFILEAYVNNISTFFKCAD
jgi:hypothetical protein